MSKNGSVPKKGKFPNAENGSVPEKGVFQSVLKLLVKQNTEITHESFVQSN